MPLSSSTQLHFALSLVRNQTVSMAATYKRLKQEQQELANLESGTSGATVETKKNKQRVLVLASRGITQRYRHLMEDVLTLLPHSVKESKFDQVMFGG
jgi:ribosome biogenesis protein BRX1